MYNVRYNSIFLDNFSNIETDTLQYYVNASAFLYKYLHELGLEENIHTLALGEWLNYYDEIGNLEINGDNFKALLDLLSSKYQNIVFSDDVIENIKKFADGEIIEFNFTKSILFGSLLKSKDTINWNNNNFYKIGMGFLSFIYGPIASFVYQTSNRDNAQFKTEFCRFFENKDSIISQDHLFFIAYWLKKYDYDVSFVAEKTTKTPDLLIKNGFNQLFLEATTKNSSDKNFIRQIQKAFDDKKIKFKDATYLPGVISIDLGSYNIEKIFQGISIRQDCLIIDIYHSKHFKIFRDSEFHKQPENSLFIEIEKILNSSKNVKSLLLSQSAMIKITKEGIENPIFLTCFIKRYALPLLKISKSYYWFDAEKHA
jgi:hypothetical protein